MSAPDPALVEVLETPDTAAAPVIVDLVSIRESRDVRVELVGAPVFPGIVDGRAFRPDALELQFLRHAGEPWEVTRCLLRGDLRPIDGARPGLHIYRGHREMPPAWHPSWPEWLRQVVADLHPTSVEVLLP